MGATTGTNVDGAFPPWNFNVCMLLTSSNPMSSARKSSFSKLLFFRAIPRDPVIMMSTVSLKLRTADVYIRFKAHCIFMA